MNWFKLNPNAAFWYGAAVSMVMVSIGMCFSLIRGSELSVEALDTKLQLSGITSKNKEVTRELREVSRELKSKPDLPYHQVEKIKELELELEHTEQVIEEIEHKIIEEATEEKNEDKPNSSESDNPE
ncbi:MAG: hypothetical protein QNJ34_19345 [Xenococcaceae cyanobacterium MO_188.B29]|nr:hypothetical protein [Xenococcaceae cyanobacterium MO_188.B29]